MPVRTLPPELETMFGRDAETRAGAQLFAGGERLVTLVGPGGSGKSQLAHAIARVSAPELDARAVLASLGDAFDLEALLRIVAKAAQAGPLTSSGRDPDRSEALERVANAIGTKEKTLFILDDADAVVGGVARLVRAALVAGDSARFLVTSQEALGIDGERVVPVGPLDRDAARAMFEARAEGGTWKPSELEALVDQLDGLPLAIELAARRSRLVGPSELLARLGEVFRLLKTDRRDVAARHATLAATIEHSLSRLDDDEARAFPCLGVFEGPFTVEAFEAVVGPELASDPIDVAEALLRKSLAQTAPAEGSARLTMLRTLRAFARARFAELPRVTQTAIEARHATFYVERAEAEAARTYGPNADEALDALAAIAANLLRAIDRVPEIAPRAVWALTDVFVLRNVIDLRSAIFANATTTADASGVVLSRVRTRLTRAKVLLELSQSEEAEALLVEALALAEGLPEAADVRRSLGWARIALGQADAALPVLEEAYAAHHAAGQMRGEADALAARGLLRGLLGDLPAGHRDLENAYALHVLAADAIRREKVREMADLLGLTIAKEDETGTREERIARLEAEADAHRASGRTWREVIARHRIAEIANPSASATGTAGKATVPAQVMAPWVFGPESRSVRSPSGEEMDLTRHGSLRKVLDALVIRRLEAPGIAQSASDLLEAGWPGERVRHESGMLRVYSVIRRVRALGLGSALVTRDDGYLLDPQAAVVRS